MDQQTLNVIRACVDVGHYPAVLQNPEALIYMGQLARRLRLSEYDPDVVTSRATPAWERALLYAFANRLRDLEHTTIRA